MFKRQIPLVPTPEKGILERYSPYQSSKNFGLTNQGNDEGRNAICLENFVWSHPIRSMYGKIYLYMNG